MFSRIKFVIMVFAVLAVAVFANIFVAVAPVQAANEEVTFAMLPQISNAEVFKKWKSILEYLEKETGIKFIQVFPKDFDEHVQMCKEGKVGFAYSNPFTYLAAAPKAGVRTDGQQVIAIAKTAKGDRDFYGLFIVRADNDAIKGLQDLKGKHGWVVGYTSAAGFILQYAHAMAKGIDLKKDCQLTESPGNKQEKVVMAVINKDTDFGCVRNGMLDTVKDRMDITQVKVLEETDKYPAWAFSAYSSISPELVQKVKDALLRAPESLLKEADLPGKITGFTPSSDADFDAWRAVADKVGQEY